MTADPVTSHTAPPVETPLPNDALLCPRCGYDLRATTSDRCSECGLKIDRTALLESGFPWAHRKRIGSIRAYWRTVRYVTFDSKPLRHEMAKPQAMPDARAFRRWNTIYLAAALLAPLLLFLVHEGVEQLVVTPRERRASSMYVNDPAYFQDIRVPWSAGVVFWPVLPLCAIALSYYLTGASVPVFRLGQFPQEHQVRARAVATYAAAPLSLLAPAVALSFAFGFALKYVENIKLQVGLIIGLTWTIAAGALAAAAVVASLVQSGRWRARASHAGAGTAIFAAVELLVRWCVGIAVFAWFIPWCVGYTWIVIDSFR